MRQHQDYPAPTARRRVLGLVLAAAMAVLVLTTVMDPPGGIKRQPKPLVPDAAICSGAQVDGCVGGRVLLLPQQASTAKPEGAPLAGVPATTPAGPSLVANPNPSPSPAARP